MTIRLLPTYAALFTFLAMGCSGRVLDDSSDGGSAQGGAGAGGASTGAGGQATTGGSAAAAGGMNTGGSGTGGSGAGGVSAVGAAGTGAGGAQCPPLAPDIGSACPIALRGMCSYTGGCCGLTFFCDGNEHWALLPTRCGCHPPAPPVDAGPITCGTQTCSPNEVCVQPAYNLCGPQPPCVPELDGGGCPSGTMRMDFCAGTSSGGCVAIPKPGPPHCATMPSSCGSTPSCGCLPNDICGPSGVDECSGVQDRHVDCLCTAP